MFNRVFISLNGLILAFAISTSTSAQIRVVSYNSAQFNGDPVAMEEVLQAASEDDSHGFATPVSIFMFQEVDEEELSMLQKVVGPNYTMGVFTDQNDSSWGGAQAMFYLSTQFIENELLHQDIYTGASRHADRWALEVLGYENQTVYVYSMHLKSATGSENQEKRRAGAENIRDDLMTLPEGSHVIVVGDMNFYSPTEPGYVWFTNSGSGQLIDPLGNGVGWDGGSNAIKHTQSPLSTQNGGLIGGGLDDRFDFQFVSPSLLDGGGFELMEGTYRALGNDGNHYNDAITAGNNTYFPGDTPRGNALADNLIAASDHLPLIVDYRLPAVFGWTMTNPSPEMDVLVGADLNAEFEIRNDAPVLVESGADILLVEIIASGDSTGYDSVSIPALGEPELLLFPIDTSSSGIYNANFTLTSKSQETQTTPTIVSTTGNVLEHANASFSFTEDVDWNVFEVTYEQGSGVQTFDVWLFNFEYDGTQSLLEIDDVTIPEPPLFFGGLSTNSVGSIPVLMQFEIDTDAVSPNTYTSFLPITVSDEDLLGEQSDISMLTIRVEITGSNTCSEDFDGDGQVDVADILLLIGAWDSTNPSFDLDSNGTVGISDLLMLIAAWGPC